MASTDKDHCPWMFHGIGRHENGDGTVTLVMDGWNYPTNAQRAEFGPGRIKAEHPCMTRTVPLQFVTWKDEPPMQVVESETAASMVHEHVGEHYTVMFQGKGWTVEISSFYPLWQMTS